MRNRPDGSVVPAALLLSGAGHVVHNLAEFPVTILWGWETLLPVAITGLLGVALYVRPGRASAAVVAGWALVVLVFGGGSVIPFGFLPFVPEQSIAHYLAHLAYAVTQLPLLWVGIRGLRPGRSTAAESIV